MPLNKLRPRRNSVIPVCFFLFGKVLAAKSSRKLSDSIHALGEKYPCLSTVCEKILPPTPASFKVKKIAGIVGRN